MMVRSINRTFMELKPESPQSSPAPSFVLIEPLWNWNMYLLTVQRSALSINRTFMELKLSKRKIGVNTSWY